ncbi:MAG TPA: gamma-glutamyl-gamma-aminobutyrate hydrolase family protein, partial [Acidimicrobiia bacterium]|jgi:putative glutamine amidotransferase|nr:gamma-glutamyl-gamma-aminobutyrate hydrolase family protein [Acidimicrobiia bacterium]
MVTAPARPVVAVIGRHLAEFNRWPYSNAMVSPRGYLNAVARAGALPVLIDPVGDPRGVLDRVDALVLTGGPDLDPKRYGQAAHPRTYGVDADIDDFEYALVHDALTRELPTLAICRGFQVLNVALGGTLYQHIPDDPGVEPHGRPGEPNSGRTQLVTIDPGTRLAKVMGTTRPVVTCHHHQAVAELGDGLRVVARADDGIIEGLELEPDRGWLLAVQWHPEDTAASDPAQQHLFDALVTECAPLDSND